MNNSSSSSSSGDSGSLNDNNDKTAFYDSILCDFPESNIGYTLKEIMSQTD